MSLPIIGAHDPANPWSFVARRASGKERVFREKPRSDGSARRRGRDITLNEALRWTATVSQIGDHAPPSRWFVSQGEPPPTGDPAPDGATCLYVVKDDDGAELGRVWTVITPLPQQPPMTVRS